MVQLKIYNILGREGATLVNKKQQPGNCEVTFTANGLSSGIYFLRFEGKLFYSKPENDFN